MQNAPAAPKSSKAPLIIGVLVGVLFVVPCCIGSIAAFAIPAFVNYTRRAKTTEATSNLRSLALLEQQYCEEHGNWLVPAGPVPATPSSFKQLADFASDPTFTQLGFAPADPVYYSYMIVRDASTTGGIELIARGDLDDDGVLSSFAVTCSSGCSCESTPRVENDVE
jgi:type II secretory pathway pseudopilin PulG